MINSFLVTLLNSPTAPVVPGATTPLPLWPESYTPYTYSPEEAELRSRLFSGNIPEFTQAIQLLWVVETSPLWPFIFMDDPRVSYTQSQLAGQFSGLDSAAVRQNSRQILQLGLQLPVEWVQHPQLRRRIGQALSNEDKLAAVICHFGLRR